MTAHGAKGLVCVHVGRRVDNGGTKFRVYIRGYRERQVETLLFV